MIDTKIYGFLYETPEETAYVFGSASLPSYATREILEPLSDWRQFLPQVEAQKKFGTETYNCTSFTILNCCEILIKRKYGLDVNFSDRWLGWATGIGETGVDPRKTAETLRKGGVPDEVDWQFTQDITSRDEYYKNPPPKLIEIARDFLDAWNFKHYIVPSEKTAIRDARKFSPLGLSASAWKEEGGIYRQFGRDNHFVTNIFEDEQAEIIFDSYDSYVKRYDIEAKPALVMGYYLSKAPNLRPFYCKWFPSFRGC